MSGVVCDCEVPVSSWKGHREGMNSSRAGKYILMFQHNLAFEYYKLRKIHDDPCKPIDWPTVKATVVTEDGYLAPSVLVEAIRFPTSMVPRHPPLIRASQSSTLCRNTLARPHRSSSDANQPRPTHRLIEFLSREHQHKRLERDDFRAIV